MPCLCCEPDDLLQCMQCVAPSPPDNSDCVRLNVKSLAGSCFADLTVPRSLTVGELILHVEQDAKMCQGRFVRWLVWGGMQLEDSQTLQHLGMLGREDLVAICADGIEGDFEQYQPGCPTCDYDSVLQQLSFSKNGTVSVQTSFYGEANIFDYSLGALRDGPKGPERPLELTPSPLNAVQEEDEISSRACTGIAGILYLDAKDALRRRVVIPAMNIDVKDLRFLKRRAMDQVQVRMQMLWASQQEEVYEPWLSEDDVLDIAESFHGSFKKSRYDRGFKKEPVSERKKQRVALIRAELASQARQKRRSAFENRVRKLERSLRMC